jgi:hypothetical protein
MRRHKLIREHKKSRIEFDKVGNSGSIRKVGEKYSISQSYAANSLTRREEYQYDYLTYMNMNNSYSNIKPTVAREGPKHYAIDT